MVMISVNVSAMFVSSALRLDCSEGDGEIGRDEVPLSAWAPLLVPAGGNSALKAGAELATELCSVVTGSAMATSGPLATAADADTATMPSAAPPPLFISWKGFRRSMRFGLVPDTGRPLNFSSVFSSDT